MKGVAQEPMIDRDQFFTGSRNAWMDRIRVELDYTLPGLADSVRNLNAKRTQHLHDVCLRWQKAPTFDFNDVFEGELGAIVEQPLLDYLAHASRLYIAQQSNAEIDLSLLYPPVSANLLTHMLSDLRRENLDPAVSVARVSDFFRSPEAHAVAFARISALFWAGVAREVRAGRSPATFPRSGMGNDIDMVAAYSPFCDAMFVDKQIFNLASMAELKRELAGNARMFSFRDEGDQDFLIYLNEIEAAATPEHLEGVRVVYGPNWPKPYWELLDHR